MLFVTYRINLARSCESKLQTNVHTVSDKVEHNSVNLNNVVSTKSTDYTLYLSTIKCPSYTILVHIMFNWSFRFTIKRVEIFSLHIRVHELSESMFSDCWRFINILTTVRQACLAGCPHWTNVFLYKFFSRFSISLVFTISCWNQRRHCTCAPFLHICLASVAIRVTSLWFLNATM